MEEGLVKQYIITPSNKSRFFVIGADREYFVTHNSCSCESFQRSLGVENQKICKHIRAVEIALQEKKVETFHISRDEYRELRSYLFGIKI